MNLRENNAGWNFPCTVHCQVYSTCSIRIMYVYIRLTFLKLKMDTLHLNRQSTESRTFQELLTLQRVTKERKRLIWKMPPHSKIWPNYLLKEWHVTSSRSVQFSPGSSDKMSEIWNFQQMLYWIHRWKFLDACNRENPHTPHSLPCFVGKNLDCCIVIVLF